MNSTTEHVFIEALSLPTQERASLVHKLLQSLEPAASSAEIEAAWKQEALDRCAAFERGDLMEREAEDVLKEVYRKASHVFKCRGK